MKRKLLIPFSSSSAEVQIAGSTDKNNFKHIYTLALPSNFMYRRISLVGDLINRYTTSSKLLEGKTPYTNQTPALLDIKVHYDKYDVVREYVNEGQFSTFPPINIYKNDAVSENNYTVTRPDFGSVFPRNFLSLSAHLQHNAYLITQEELLHNKQPIYPISYHDVQYGWSGETQEDYDKSTRAQSTNCCNSPSYIFDKYYHDRSDNISGLDARYSDVTLSVTTVTPTRNEDTKDSAQEFLRNKIYALCEVEDDPANYKGTIENKTLVYMSPTRPDYTGLDTRENIQFKVSNVDRIFSAAVTAFTYFTPTSFSSVDSGYTPETGYVLPLPGWEIQYNQHTLGYVPAYTNYFNTSVHQLSGENILEDGIKANDAANLLIKNKLGNESKSVREGVINTSSFNSVNALYLGEVSYRNK